MPIKNPEERKRKAKEYSRKYYEANKEKVKALSKTNRAVGKARWSAFKCTLKCTKCGFAHPAALDFHHEDPSEKEYNINRLISNGQFKKAEAELEKCIVLCANCHRIHHHDAKKKPPEGGSKHKV